MFPIQSKRNDYDDDDSFSSVSMETDATPTNL
jgi:hypothetical protein